MYNRNPKYMAYQIYVYYNNALLFSTQKKNINNKYVLRKVLEIFKKKFPFEDGFDLKITQQNQNKKDITVFQVLEQ